jgi:hypothetical protein
MEEAEAKQREKDMDYMLLYGIAKLFSMQSTRFIGEIKNQKDSHFFNQAVKKKKYSEGHTYYKAAQKIDPSNEDLAGKIERTESFLKLVKNAEELQKGGGKGKEEKPIHNENNPLESPEALKEYAQAIVAGDAAVKVKKYQEAEIQFVKAYNLKQTDELNAKLEEVKAKVDRLIEANVIAPREEWSK